MTDEAAKIRLVMELRSGGITDTGVLAAIERLPREEFVPATFQEHAYENTALPIRHGQTISQPFVVAYMTEALGVSDRHKVLEIGTGSGYQAAVLAQLCRRVYTIERFRALSREAQARFAALGLSNITTMVGDGSKGWPEQAPFDRIIVTAAAASAPDVLLEQLAEGGVLITPIGRENLEQQLVRYTKTKDGLREEVLLPVRFVPLVAGVANEH